MARFGQPSFSGWAQQQHWVLCHVYVLGALRLVPIQETKQAATAGGRGGFCEALRNIDTRSHIALRFEKMEIFVI